jgi:hypothetical protein
LRTNTNVVSDIVCKSLVSVCFCLILGVALYQSFLFSVSYSSFQIVLYGIIGSLFFFSLQINVRNSFALLLAMFVLQCGLLSRPSHWQWLIREATFTAAVAGSLYVYYNSFYRRTAQLRTIHPLVLGTIFVLAFSLATVIVGLMEWQAISFLGRRLCSAVQVNAVNGFVIGLGIGLGILTIDNGYLTLARILARRLLWSIGASFREFGERL